MKVRIDRITYEAPTRKDHLIKVPREALFRHIEDEYGRVEDDEERVELLVKAVAHRGLDLFLEYSGIVCDFCGDPIPYPYVWCLVCGGYTRGAICQKCKDRNWQDKPAYVIHADVRPITNENLKAILRYNFAHPLINL